MIPGLHGEGQRTDAARLARADHLDDTLMSVHSCTTLGLAAATHRPAAGAQIQRAPCTASHGFQSSDAALIAAGEHSDPAFLTQLTVHAAFVDGDAKHARGSLACKLRDHPRLDRKKSATTNR